jgi:hypothetical protein
MKCSFTVAQSAGAIALILVGLTSCDSPTAIPTPTAPPEAPSPTAPPTTSQVTQRNFACNTPNYVAEIRGKDNEITMTFGPKAGSLMLQNAPVSYSTGPDSSQIYVFAGETTTTTTIYPNRDCLLRVVSGITGETTVQESGRIAAIGTSGQRPPEPAPKPPEPTPSVENPEPDDLNLICRGTIQERVDFSVYFTREWGFNRIEFRPRSSGATLTGDLDYSGKNEQGQDLWKGSVNAMADVVLVHLSTAAAQPGDQVSVRYDAGWGRGLCE